VNERAGRLLAGSVLPAVGLAVAAGAVAVTAGDLPDPIATHWDFGGTPNGTTDRGVSLVVALVLVAGVGAAALWASRRRDVIRGELGIPLAVAAFAQWLLVGVTVSIVVANRDAATWTEAADLPVLVVLLVPFVAFLAAALARRLVGGIGRPPENESGDGPSVGATETERLAWFAEVRARWPVAISAVLPGAAAVAFLSAAPLLALVLVVAAVPAVVFTVVRVRVDHDGLTLRFGPLGWPRVRIPLERIERADVIDVKPMRHGGWGYRGSLRLFGRAAVVVRRGDAIQLHLRDGRKLVVTVDGAAVGAGTINDLVRQTVP
jgi:Domain of unknown function (DUF1648)